MRHRRGDHPGVAREARRRRIHHRRRRTGRDHHGPARHADRHPARHVRRHPRLDGAAELAAEPIARPTAATVVVTSIAAPSTSPVMPPKRRTQCATSTALHASADQHDDRPLPRCADPRAAPAQRAPPARPRPPPPAGCPPPSRRACCPAPTGTDRRQAATAATRPAVDGDDHRDRAQFGEGQPLHQRSPPPRLPRRTGPPFRRASPAVPAPAGRSSRDRRRCRPGRRCAGPSSRAAAPRRRVRPVSGWPWPKASDATHTTAAANAPSATPTTGRAVMTPRPIPDPARSGSTVPNAKAPVTERITTRRWPRRRSTSTAARRRRPAPPAVRPPRRCPRRGASTGRRSVRVPASPAPACGPARWTDGPRATTAARPARARSATIAAAVTTTPSSSTGVRRTAACAQNPAMAARSAPPHTRSNPSGSAVRPRARYNASRTAATFRDQPASSIPVPRPTTTTGSAPVSAAINAVAAVVFPIPISPAISRSAPASTSSSAIRRPASTAACASSAVSASSTAMLPLLLSNLVRADRRRNAVRRRPPRCPRREQWRPPPRRGR